MIDLAEVGRSPECLVGDIAIQALHSIAKLESVERRPVQIYQNLISTFIGHQFGGREADSRPGARDKDSLSGKSHMSRLAVRAARLQLKLLYRSPAAGRPRSCVRDNGRSPVG